MVASFNSKLSPVTDVASGEFVFEVVFLQDAVKRLVRLATAKVELVRNSFLFIISGLSSYNNKEFVEE